MVEGNCQLLTHRQLVVAQQIIEAGDFTHRHIVENGDAEQILAFADDVDAIRRRRWRRRVLWLLASGSGSGVILWLWRVIWLVWLVWIVWLDLGPVDQADLRAVAVFGYSYAPISQLPYCGRAVKG